jgi:hypothetical protein
MCLAFVLAFTTCWQSAENRMKMCFVPLYTSSVKPAAARKLSAPLSVPYIQHTVSAYTCCAAICKHPLSYE